MKRRANKNHRCDWCACTIEKGETYWYDSGPHDGGWRIKVHAECRSAHLAIKDITDRLESWEFAGHYQKGHFHEPNDGPFTDCPGCIDKNNRKEVDHG